MGQLYEQISSTLSPGMSIPTALQLLFSWIEKHNLFLDRDDGTRVGFLADRKNRRISRTEFDKSVGTWIEFFAGGYSELKYWFGHDRPEVINRLYVFAMTGGDGSMAAFWLADDGTQKIVHLGSGSGSTLVCVLANDPVDFLRLLAIGYDEICWSELYASPPSPDVHPNTEFQSWLKETFSVSIPTTASEIVRIPALMDDDESADPFWRWVRQSVE